MHAATCDHVVLVSMLYDSPSLFLIIAMTAIIATETEIQSILIQSQSLNTNLGVKLDQLFLTLTSLPYCLK